MAKRNHQRGGQHGQDHNANDQWEPENSRGPRGYGHSQSYGGALGYPDETLRTPQGARHVDATSTDVAGHTGAGTTPKSK